jgi:hypothetical protein
LGGLRFECKDLKKYSIDEIARQYGAIPDNSSREGWSAYYESREDEVILHNFTQIHALNAVNSRGFYITQDDNVGDPIFRVRALSYCLFHDKVAVCGTWSIMKLKNPKGSLLNDVLNVLRTVRFVDSQQSPSSEPAVQN